MAYKPIDSYGIIGDMHTCALVGMDGSIDWLCLPHFDSPSAFGALLDDAKGGRFRITATHEGKYRQFYIPETNILVTRFLSPDGVAELIDYMPVREEPMGRHRSRIVRTVRGVRGRVPMRMICRPAFDYARRTHAAEVGGREARFRSEGRGPGLALAGEVPLSAEDGAAAAAFTVSEGDELCFVLCPLGADEAEPPPLPAGDPARTFARTRDFWRAWRKRCTYQGRWREMVRRSAMILKLLTFEPTGAIVAAATTSLPERIGGGRNWDYRFTWIRDAAFTLYALMRIGYTDEAEAFMGWVQNCCKCLGDGGSLHTMYRIDGGRDMAEEELPHLEGYMGSRPVRVGNGAHDQLQLDIYGALLDSVYIYNKHKPISYDFWLVLRRLVNWVCDNWRRKDSGIWESRGGLKDHVYSKMMCWIAVDRALRLAAKRSFPADRPKWYETRDEMYEEIMSKGWNRERQSFVQSYGSEVIDAANLLMPLTFFIAPTDPRMTATLDAIMRGLAKDSLVFRYDLSAGAEDGLEGEEGTFSLCTFWLVEALTRAGRLDEARNIFERMLGYANHVGIFSEEISMSGDSLGNTPQAFTHLSLISAAFNLNRALGD